MFECNANKATVAAADGNLTNTTSLENACLNEIYSPGMSAINGSSIAARDSLKTNFAWNSPIDGSLDRSFKLQEASLDGDGGSKGSWSRGQAVEELSKIVGSALEQRDKTV